MFPRFFRVSVETTGDIIAEFGAAHVVRKIDWSKWPWPESVMPRSAFPATSVTLDRYGDYKLSKNSLTPFVIRDAPDNAECLRTILAMKPADVSHMQCDDNGCGPAVVARLTRSSYAEVVRTLYPSGNVRILGTQRLAKASGTIRHECKRGTWEEVADANAVAVLIKNQDPRLGRHWGHYVSIDPGMIIVDPELVLCYPLAEYPRKAWTPLMYFVRT